jgi:hypothetical protein
MCLVVDGINRDEVKQSLESEKSEGFIGNRFLYVGGAPRKHAHIRMPQFDNFSGCLKKVPF